MQTEQESEVALVQAGEDTAVETASIETEAGLLGDEKVELSVEEIMSEGEAEDPTLDDAQHGINKKIGKEVGKRKVLEQKLRVVEQENIQLKTIQSAPSERPQVPVREDFDTAEDYRAEYVKYEDNTVSYNNSQAAVNDQGRRAEQSRASDIKRFEQQAVRLRTKFPEFDELVTSDNPDGSNPFGSVADLVLSAENNAGLGLFLRKNPDKLEALNEMDRSKALLKIGEYSGRFNTVQKTKTNAPKALNTIKEGSDTPVTDIYKIKNNDDFLRERNREILRKRKQGG